MAHRGRIPLVLAFLLISCPLSGARGAESPEERPENAGTVLEESYGAGAAVPSATDEDGGDAQIVQLADQVSPPYDGEAPSATARGDDDLAASAGEHELSPSQLSDWEYLAMAQDAFFRSDSDPGDEQDDIEDATDAEAGLWIHDDEDLSEAAPAVDTAEKGVQTTPPAASDGTEELSGARPKLATRRAEASSVSTSQQLTRREQYFPSPPPAFVQLLNSLADVDPLLFFAALLLRALMEPTREAKFRTSLSLESNVARAGLLDTTRVSTSPSSPRGPHNGSAAPSPRDEPGNDLTSSSSPDKPREGLTSSSSPDEPREDSSSSSSPDEPREGSTSSSSPDEHGEELTSSSSPDEAGEGSTSSSSPDGPLSSSDEPREGLTSSSSPDEPQG